MMHEENGDFQRMLIAGMLVLIDAALISHTLLSVKIQNRPARETDSG
jgi:hypothetical protein